MLDGGAVAAALRTAGLTHVVWIPDSALGTWEEAWQHTEGLTLVRVCREGEAFAVAAGLHLGGKKPMVVLQCTGLFEAGDSLRNFLHDLKLPLFLIVGVRSYFLHARGQTQDSCPVFTEPILRAWQVPYVVLNESSTAADLGAEYRRAQAEQRAGAVLIPE